MDPLIQTAVEHRIDYLRRRHARMKRLSLALCNFCNEYAREIAELTRALNKPQPRRSGATTQRK